MRANPRHGQAPGDGEDLTAGQLEGLKLEGGWTVTERMRLRESTGGNFSVGYTVLAEDGREAFLKAIDLSRALRASDVTAALESLTTAFNFERDLLRECSDAHLTRVVDLLGYGTVPAEAVDGQVPVPYLILEKADGDIRQHLARVSDRIDTAYCMRTLHHVAVALQQMHGKGIAHQDVKPSNVLVFGRQGSKIGDVGSASRRGVSSPRDHLRWAGDRRYSPPEVLYEEPGSGWEFRRRACDLYQLGSMATFFLVGTGMTPLLMGNVDPTHAPETWGGDYAGVLPHLQYAFSRAILTVRDNTPPELGDGLVEAIRQQCEPNPQERGHPRSKLGVGSQYSVERYVSLYDRLAKEAEIRLRTELSA